MEADGYCTAVFLDISQAFDKIFIQGLLCKIKNRFPTDLCCYAIIRSYLLYSIFKIKYEEVVIRLKEIKSGMPQDSILGPVLYLLYIADLPVALGSTIAIYADDIACVS
jgi:hypothetical protein